MATNKGWLCKKVVKRHALDQRHERSRDGNVVGIGYVRFAADFEAMHLGVERRIHLAGRARKLNPHAAFGDRVNTEAFLLQPCC